MPWDDNSGNKGRNPWGNQNGGGGNRKNPWGGGSGGNGGGNNGGGGRGPNQPDIDDFITGLQDSLRGLFPGNTGGGKLFLLLPVAVIALWLSSGFFTVGPGDHAVVQRFGKWTQTIETEGLKYRLPRPLEKVTKVNVNELRSMNIGFTGPVGRGTQVSAGRDVPEESLMLTSDFNIVDVDFVVQWDISSAKDFIFNIQNPEQTLRKVSQSAIREVVGQTRMFPIITTDRVAVAENAKAIMQKILDSYNSGINISEVLINSAEVHPEVQAAFQDVQSAKQDAEDYKNKARAYREDILPKAGGEATRLLQQAEGYKLSIIARADGDADRFNSVLEAYKSGEDVTKERMYLETMEQVLGNAQKIILDDKGGQGVVPYLPLNELNRTAPAAGSSSVSKGQ